MQVFLRDFSDLILIYICEYALMGYMDHNSLFFQVNVYTFRLSILVGHHVKITLFIKNGAIGRQMAVLSVLPLNFLLLSILLPILKRNTRWTYWLKRFSTVRILKTKNQSWVKHFMLTGLKITSLCAIHERHDGQYFTLIESMRLK